MATAQQKPSLPVRRPLWARITFWVLGLFAAGLVAVALLVGYALVVAAPNLPSLDTITDYRPKIPLRIYTADNVLGRPQKLRPKPGADPAHLIGPPLALMPKR